MRRIIGWNAVLAVLAPIALEALSTWIVKHAAR